MAMCEVWCALATIVVNNITYGNKNCYKCKLFFQKTFVQTRRWYLGIMSNSCRIRLLAKLPTPTHNHEVEQTTNNPEIYIIARAILENKLVETFIRVMFN